MGKTYLFTISVSSVGLVQAFYHGYCIGVKWQLYAQELVFTNQLGWQHVRQLV